MAISTRTFRLFVSSTFSDLVAERNALQERVFPRLRQLAAQHGSRFQVIDLRWGVSEEASLDQQAMNICLGEIARCQETSPRPNFIILLGDRYGWIPPPAQISEEQFTRILKEISSEDQAFILSWYTLDQNAVPAKRLLKPRQRGGPYEKYADWQPVEARLHQILETAARSITLREKDLLPYIASATEQEITAGALQVRDAAEHVACFLRSIEGLPRQFEPAARDYLDLNEELQVVDGEAKKKQEALKIRLAQRLISNVFRYQARWTGSGITTSHIDPLCDDVYTFLARIIKAEFDHPHFAPTEKKSTHIQTHPVLDDEGRAHHRFAEERLRFFVGRRETLANIAGYFRERQHRTLVITGAGGTGKSALMARAIQLAQETFTNAQIVYRFIGATPSSTDGRSLLDSLCREIARGYQKNETDLPLELRELVHELGKRMTLATSEKPLVLFLDSLDQLSANPEMRNLAWLPNTLPEHVSVIISTRKEADITQALVGKQTREEMLCGLTLAEGRDLLSQWLTSIQRTLGPTQQDEVLSKFEQSEGNPLYLKLAFEEARLWSSSQPLERLAVGIQGIIEQNMIHRLAQESNHGDVLVSHALGYLAASRHGLAEDELVDLLSRDPDVFGWFLKNTYHFPADLLECAAQYRSRLGEGSRAGTMGVWLREMRKNGERLSSFLNEILPKANAPRLPVVLWSRLSSDLAPYLSEHLVDHSPLLRFYHRELGDVTAKVFLNQGKDLAYHARLAGYFRLKADPTGDKSWMGQNPHALSELPYHLLQASQVEEAFQILTDIVFVEHKAAEVGVVEYQDKNGEIAKSYAGILQLQEDYTLALRKLPDQVHLQSDQSELPILTVIAKETGQGPAIRCPACQGEFPVTKEQLGREVRCPGSSCQATWRINNFVLRSPQPEKASKKAGQPTSQAKSPEAEKKKWQFWKK